MTSKICSDICPWALSVLLRSRKTVRFSEQINHNIRRQISELIFAPNRGYCLYSVKKTNTVSPSF